MSSPAIDALGQRLGIETLPIGLVCARKRVAPARQLRLLEVGHVRLVDEPQRDRADAPQDVLRGGEERPGLVLSDWWQHLAQNRHRRMAAPSVVGAAWVLGERDELLPVAQDLDPMRRVACAEVFARQCPPAAGYLFERRAG
jgi:hypothetical protein